MARNTSWGDLNAMTEQLDRAIDRMLATDSSRSGGWLPPADVFETEDEVVVQLDVPGLDPENISAEVVNGQLVVAGERRQSQAKRFYRNERWTGRFVRTFALGPRLRGDNCEAEYRDGVLTLRLPKPEETKPRRIEISRQAREIESA